MNWQHIAQRPEFISQLALWFHHEWGFYNPQNSILSRCEELKAKVDNGILPLTMVASIDAKLVGTYSLDLTDLPKRPDLSPWLASVYVHPEHRNLGIGSLVVRKSLEHAHSLGIKTLYLFTSHHAHWYESMGWQMVEETTYGNDEPVTVMKFAI